MSVFSDMPRPSRLRSKDIHAGALLLFHTSEGRDVSVYIKSIADGKVHFAPTPNARPRWWLPYPYVKECGVLIRP